MKHEIDLKNYQIRTDLIVEQVTDENNVSTKVYDENGIKITTVEVDKNMSEQIKNHEVQKRYLVNNYRK